VTVHGPRKGVQDLDEAEVVEEPTDRQLPSMLFARRIAEFNRLPESAEQNESVIRAAITHFQPNLHGRHLPEWAQRDTALVFAAVRKGWSGVYHGRDKELAIMMLKQNFWIAAANVPQDQDWIEENVFKHACLWQYLDQERKARIAVRFVATGSGNFEFCAHRDSLRSVKDCLPEEMHTALEQAQAGRYGKSDKHHTIALLGRCVHTGTVKDARALRALPLEAFASACERGVAVGLDKVKVSRLLRAELRKRKTPLRATSDQMITFLGANLPPEEARELILKTAGVSRKRDLAAFLEDF